MSLLHLPADTTAAETAEALNQHGACIVDQLVPAATMDGIADELAPFLAATAAGTDEFAGRLTRRTGALIARSVTSRDLVMHPLVLGTAGRVLAKATSFQLHLTQAIAIGPGEVGQMIHRDQWAFDFFPFPFGYEVQCNTIWAMTDFTEANGATRVVPGSHRAEDGQTYHLDDTVPAEMAKGSVLLYTGAVYHGGGANTSDETRVGVNITYNVSWLRQEENQYLAVPPEVVATLDEPLLRVMGYAKGAYALGYVDDLRDPLEVVRPDLFGADDAERTGFGV